MARSAPRSCTLTVLRKEINHQTISLTNCDEKMTNYEVALPYYFDMLYNFLEIW